jgi:hypothetical protein
MYHDNGIEMTNIKPSKSMNTYIRCKFEREQKNIREQHKETLINEYSKIIDNYLLDKIKEEIRIIQHQILNYIIYIKNFLIINHKIKWCSFNEKEKNEFIDKLKKENYNIIKFEIKLKLLKERLAYMDGGKRRTRRY